MLGWRAVVVGGAFGFAGRQARMWLAGQAGRAFRFFGVNLHLKRTLRELLRLSPRGSTVQHGVFIFGRRYMIRPG